MKFFLKSIKYIVVAFVLLIVVGLFAAAWGIDALARKGIEAGATYALGVPTKLGSASVGITSASLKMANLNVANPAGFPGDHFLTLGDGAVAVSLSSLQKDTVEVPTFALNNLDVILERKGDSSNYQKILDNLGKLSSGDTTKKDPNAPSKKFVIKDLSLKNVNVHLNLTGADGVVGELTKINVPIDEIKLSDVGKTGEGVAGTGVTIGELSKIIVQAILSAAVDKGGGLIPGDVLGDLKGRLSSLGDVQKLGMKVLGDAKGSIQETGKKAVEDAVDKGKKAVDDVINKGLKDLVPGKKK